MDQWVDYFPPLNLWNYNLYHRWFNKEDLDMIACVCRNIQESDYSSEQELKSRVMESDFKCGLCQLRYELDLKFPSDGPDLASTA